MIFTVIKDVLSSLTSRRCQDESILELDYKLSSYQQALMKLCFSPLANWLLFVWACLLFINPFRFQFQFLSQFPILLNYIYSPNWSLGLSIGILLAYFIGLHNLAIAVTLYFVSQAEIHVVIGLFIIAGIFLGQNLRFVKLIIKLEGGIRKTLLYYSGIHFIALVAAIYLNTQFYIYLDIKRYFSASVFSHRFEFLVLSLVLFYLIQFVFLSLWGHFYIRRPIEPSRLEISYSTVKIFKQLSVREKIQIQLEKTILEKINNLEAHLKDSASQYLPQDIRRKAEKELSYLNMAKEELV